MSVEERKVIDAIGIRRSDDRVVLTVTDHLPWLPDNEHLQVLQDKLNDYLAFIESGEVYGSYPQARGKEIEIQVIHKYPPVGDGIVFLERVGMTIRAAGFHFSSQTSDET